MPVDSTISVAVTFPLRSVVSVSVDFIKSNAVSVSVQLPISNAPDNVCLPVAIINQDFLEIASVASGGSYNVVQLEELVDDEDLNTTTVLDTI